MTNVIDVEFLSKHWWVVARTSDVAAKRPFGFRLLGKDCVLFRSKNGKLVCFEDRCPHRQVPLSLGKVVDCRLRCAYHGWEFDEAGYCTSVPGRLGPQMHAPLMQPYVTHEERGLIWVSLSEDPATAKPFVTSHLGSEGMATRIADFKISAQLVDILENFLDPFHTAVLHDGIIRTDVSRSVNKIMPCHTEDGFEVRYTKEAPQANWLRHFQRKIDLDLGRFRMPGIIELEFYAGKTLEFANTFYITPVDQANVHMFTVVSLRARILPAWLLFLFLKPFLLRALKQDIWMLELQNQASQKYPGRKQICLDTDVVRRQLELSLSGRPDKVKFKDLKALL